MHPITDYIVTLIDHSLNRLAHRYDELPQERRSRYFANIKARFKLTHYRIGGAPHYNARV